MKAPPFSLLSNDATWTVMGPTDSAKTYTIPQLEQEIIKPFNARLKPPLQPNLIDVFQDGNTVIILFEAQAKMIDETVYRNNYAWFFTMNGTRVVHVKAVLDLNAFDALMRLEIP